MKIITLIALPALLLAAGSATAQTDDYAAFLNDVASRSPQLTAAQKNHTATLRGLRTGLAPDDPEVGLEYFFAGETRYASLKKAMPELAEKLFQKAETESKERLEKYKTLAQND